MFGSGVNGPRTITSGTATIFGDVYYTNLTINSGAKLNTNGFRVFVAGTLTLMDATIENNGGASTPGGGPGARAGRSAAARSACSRSRRLPGRTRSEAPRAPGQS